MGDNDFPVMVYKAGPGGTVQNKTVADADGLSAAKKAGWKGSPDDCGSDAPPAVDHMGKATPDPVAEPATKPRKKKQPA